MYDVAIVGGGIVGLATAYQILRQQPDYKVVVLEKESAVAKHQTAHNSGVIHSGIYYKPNSSKAINCRRGYDLLLQFCDEHDVPYELCGKVIVATDKKELPLLATIAERGVANGLRGLRTLDQEELRAIEPHAAGIRAVHVPQAGIVSYLQVAQRYADLIINMGGEIQLNACVSAIYETTDKVEIVTPSHTVVAKSAITCAGLYADKLAQQTVPSADFITAPFRGEYYELKPEKRYLVKGLIYPVPNPDFPFLGVHFTKMINGGVEAGPNAVIAFKREGYKNTQINLREFGELWAHRGFRKVAMRHWQIELFEIYRSFSKKAFTQTLQRLVPALQMEDLVAGGAGVRAQAIGNDGNLIDEYLIADTRRVVNLCNAPSPAATASLSIGLTLCDKLLAKMSDL